MSDEKLWKPTGRVSDAFGAWQAVAAVGGAAWGALVAVSTWAFSTISSFMDQGWGAVFLAGLGAASAAALALGATFYGLAALTNGYARFKAPSAAATQAPSKGTAPAAPRAAPVWDDGSPEARLRLTREHMGDTAFKLHMRLLDLETRHGDVAARLDAMQADRDRALGELRERTAEEIAALRKDADRALDAIQHNAKAMREGDAATRDESAARLDAMAAEMRAETAAAVERGRDKLEQSGNYLHKQITDLDQALVAQLKAVAEVAESRTKAVFDVLSDSASASSRKTEERLDGLDASLRGFRKQVFDILRARDAEAELRELDAEASKLFEKLSRGDEREYPDAQSWQADYNAWKLLINRFWDLSRSWSESVGQPFTLTDADFEGERDVPGSRLFGADGLRDLYRFMLAVNARHMAFREDAFDLMDAKGELPRV